MLSPSKASLQALVITAAVVLAAPALAQTPTYIVRGSSQGTGCIPTPGSASFDITSSIPVLGLGGCNTGFAATTGTARAGTGSVGTESIGRSSNGDSLFLAWSSSAYAEDFVRFTSSDPDATRASVSLFLKVEGVLDSIDADASLQGSVVINGIRSFFDFSPNGSTPVSISRFNVLNGPAIIAFGTPISLLLQTFEVSVPLNQPVSLVLTLGDRVSVSGPSDFASSSFLNSFEVPLGQDAFALPDGVTANSGDWLVNNRRIDPDAGPGGVPEPASWAMLLTGFGLTGVVLRRRGRASARA